jgi:MoaA/NifB/PqqE/SkfB family radical SAM enzyme
VKPLWFKRLLRRLPHKPLWLNGPEVLQVELHNYCNEDCIYCNVEGFHGGKHGVLPRYMLATVLNQVKASIFEVRLFLNNECTLPVKDAVSLSAALKLAKKICSVRTVIYSNGVTDHPELYLDKNLDHIHLTISAASGETYRKVHGKDCFIRALLSYSYILRNKRRNQKLYVHFVSVKENLSELPLWRDIFKAADGLIISPLHDGYMQDKSKQCKSQIDYKATVRNSTLQGSMPDDMPCTLWNNMSVSCFGEYLQCCDVPYTFNYGRVGEVTAATAWQNRLSNQRKNLACRSCKLKNRNYREKHSLRRKQT